MCGFVGVFGPSAERLKTLFPEALSRLAHRGPNAEGAYTSPESLCLLGHRRLSIVDLSDSANQPWIRQGRALVYNGEIYNHLALRQSHLPAGQTYAGHSDTESLFHLLSQHSAERLLPELVGMFAGAFYDEERRQLLLFRDSLGIKPLYLLELADSTLIFASELRAILALTPDLPRRADTESLFQYLMFENWPQGRSLFSGIRLVEPGTFILAEQAVDGRCQTCWQRFMAKTPEAALSDGLHLPAQVLETIEQSVQAHLMSDVPLGSYLSGGIDSSLVTMLASRSVSGLVGFTGYFQTKEDWYDERPLSRLVAQKANIPLVEVEITPQHFSAHFDQLISVLEEPRMGMGSFSQFVVAQEAARHRKVILAGHGGDELFAGYPLFKAFWLLQTFPSGQALGSLFRLKAKEWPWLVDALLGRLRTGQFRFAPQLYADLAWQVMGKDMEPDLSAFQKPQTDVPLTLLNQYYLDTYLPGLLVVEDKVSMAHSLETRIPLWSQSLYQQMQTIPIGAKLYQGLLKGLLKQACRGLLPDELLNAPKRGFPTPLRHWFRDELREEVEQRLLDGNSTLYHLIARDKIAKLLREHRTMPLPFALDERRAHRIWMLLCLESWSRQFQVELA